MKSICYKCKQEIFEAPFEGLHPQCFCEWFGLPAPDRFTSLFHRSTPDWEPVFFQGVFPKYSATLSSKQYMIKVGEKCYHELPLMEYLCNEIATFFGMQVPKYFLIRLENRQDAFISYNFMQDQPRSDLVHIYRFLKSPRDFTCEGLLNVLQELGIKNETHRFVTLCLFDALIGNHDRHGRNLGLIHSPQGYTLAPFYDNPSYIATENLLGADLHPTGAIATKATQEPSMKDYAQEFYRLGYTDVVDQFYAQLNSKKDTFYALIHHSFVSQERKDAFLKLVNRRIEELQTVAGKEG
ncbi:MAG: HipA domain-containing protein [Chlamydiia bacterium]|nr:HipA domain-containing protein [Chlamydiia bacterium]